MTTAAVLQFSVSSGTCAVPDDDVVVYYGTQDCTLWTPFEHIRLTSTGTVSTVVVRLPADARQTDICLKWQQPARTINDTTTTNSTGCWALDNVLVNNMEDQPISIQDNFDPHKCHSDTNAMVFVNTDQDYNYVTTRDIDLDTKLGQPFFEETFDGKVEG
ncbi:hypothetical protein NP493_626g01002 [Ridgeia piscesae]|uniref:Reelin n=1 Tax=Ridgeia piscesae TaxID=27915 RepID=A0AAD9NNL4_RIDPI|nr:hypothetical protein NP493_626g01002 [Ridgeia piscesae]